MATEMVHGATIRIGSHSYTRNWAVVDSRYYVLLGMPLQKHVAPKVDYEQSIVQVDRKPLLVLEQCGTQVSHAQITNIGVKKFRSPVRQKCHREDFEFFKFAKSLILRWNP